MIENILNTPVLIKILGSLTLILAANFLTKKLLPSLICGALVLAIWTGQGVVEIADIASRRSFSLNNILLMMTVCQVMWLSSQMQATGTMDRLVKNVRGRLSSRGAMAALPAMIGFLPMPGGALFSAPMLQSCDPCNHVNDPLKGMTNHWFRHVWECWWPMFPGVLLTMELTGFDIPQMFLLGVPVSLAAILFGYLLLLRKIPPVIEKASAESFEDVGMLKTIQPLLPIAVVIISYAAIRAGYGFLSVFLPFLPGMNRYFPIGAGLLVAMFALQGMLPLSRERWGKIIFSPRVFSMAFIVLAVRIYGAFIEAELPGGGLLIEQMRLELTDWGIPLTAVIMILPFITGLATGMAVGYIGASFPIVLSLIGQDPTFGEMLSMTLVAYGFGYMGFVLSPVHVCLVVTSKHFDTPVLRNMLGLLPPAVMVMLSALGLGLFWGWVLP